MRIKAKSRGFTIVELLIVVVIIAILAAITIVAYNGIQARARTSAGQMSASSVAKKVQSYFATNNAYPTYCQLVTNTTNPGGSSVAGATGASGCTAGTTAAGLESKIDNVGSLLVAGSNIGANYTATTSNNNAVVGYWLCSATTGANVYYWDYSANTIFEYQVGAGC